jgi:glycosyltransferase involved in cell wall biosynthesis
MVVHVRIFEDAAYLASQRPFPSHVRAVVAISRAVAKELARAGVPDELVVTIYDAYRPQSSAARPRTPAAKPQIACVGRIVPVKGQEILVEAMGVLKSRGVAVRCLMVGAGDAFMQSLQQRVAALGLDDQVEWCGFQPRPLEILHRCTVAAVPSHREPLGRVIFEAWDAGCVPVAFGGSGGAAEAIDDSRGGILYDVQTPEALADALDSALALSDTARDAMVARGREWMSANCSPDRHASALQQVLRRAIGD